MGIDFVTYVVPSNLKTKFCKKINDNTAEIESEKTSLPVACLPLPVIVQPSPHRLVNQIWLPVETE